MWLLRKLLFPVSLIYGGVVYLRNRFYDWGVFTSKSYKTPIICIGNLSVGGTGKTPMVELLIELLQDNYKVSVLSRGYKRRSKGFVLADKKSSVTDLGDEPFQIHSKFNAVQVAVDANRQNGIAILEEKIKPEIILLDDAFQHRKVKPGFSILLTSFDNLFVSDWYLPTGNLRDNKKEVKRADLVIVTKIPKDCEGSELNKITNKLALNSQQDLLFSYIEYDETLYGNGSLQDLEELKSVKITLVTGIANPAPLLKFLNSQHISYVHLKFSDHHNFTVQEIENLKSKSNILVTEKDYVRLKDHLSCNYVAIKHEFFNDGKKRFKKRLEVFMNS